MKNNKLMKLFLSLLIALNITCANANLITEFDLGNYDSQIELLEEDGEESPFINIKTQ